MSTSTFSFRLYSTLPLVDEIRSNDVRSLPGQDHRRVLGGGGEEPEESRSRERTQAPAIEDLSSFVSTVEARSTGGLAPHGILGGDDGLSDRDAEGDTDVEFGSAAG